MVSSQLITRHSTITGKVSLLHVEILGKFHANSLGFWWPEIWRKLLNSEAFKPQGSCNTKKSCNVNVFRLCRWIYNIYTVYTYTYLSNCLTLCSFPSQQLRSWKIWCSEPVSKFANPQDFPVPKKRRPNKHRLIGWSERSDLSGRDNHLSWWIPAAKFMCMRMSMYV